MCVDNDGYPASLDIGKLYRCVDDPEAQRHSLVRVVDESGEDYLYPRDRFVEISLPLAAQRALAAITG